MLIINWTIGQRCTVTNPGVLTAKLRKTVVLLLGVAAVMVPARHAARAFPLVQVVQVRDTTRAAMPDTARLAAEAVLEKELEAALAGQKPAATPAPEVRATGPRSRISLNPNISVVGTFLGSVANAEGLKKQIDLGLGEAEISFQAYVDPYAKADFFVAFGKERTDPFHPQPVESLESELAPELEEAFVTSLSLPHALQVKAGLFRSKFGKVNATHPHAYGFIDLPRIFVNFLGDEGLSDTGVSLSWLVPNGLNFFQELTLEITSGAVNSPSFSVAAGNRLLYLTHLKNFFDLSDNTTLEVGFTGISGPHNAAGHLTQIGAFDLTYKWKPLSRNRYNSFTWITETLVSWRSRDSLRSLRSQENEATIRSKGLYSFVNWQVAKRWFLGGRYDYSEFPEHGDQHEQAFSGILAFYASEFQKFELQYQRAVPADIDPFNRVLFRGVFGIGAHGAHEY